MIWLDFDCLRVIDKNKSKNLWNGLFPKASQKQIETNIQTALQSGKSSLTDRSLAAGLKEKKIKRDIKAIRTEMHC